MVRSISRHAVLLLVAGLMLLAVSSASAHVTKPIGDDEFLVIVGLVKEPPYTDERNGLDLMVRSASDREPVANLEQTLFAEIIAPDGVTKRQLTVRAVYGQPGHYTADVLLTEPGMYQFRIWGYVHAVAFDEVFDTSEVLPLSSIRFPGN